MVYPTQDRLCVPIDTFQASNMKTQVQKCVVLNF